MVLYDGSGLLPLVRAEFLIKIEMGLNSGSALLGAWSMHIAQLPAATLSVTCELRIGEFRKPKKNVDP